MTPRAFPVPCTQLSINARYYVFVHTMCRVHFSSDTNEVTLLQLNKKSVDSSETTVYRDRNELPLDVQHRVAVLDLMGKNGRQADGVGYIAAPDTYWVYIDS